MKKLFTFYFFNFLLICSTTFAQKAKLGPVSENAEGELLATDPLNNTQHVHYKSMSFSIKAGSGLVFYMKSSAFTPRIVMTDKAGKQIGTYNNPDKGKGQEATVALNAFTMSSYLKWSPADTTFFIYFTSADENVTGKYNFGYQLLDSAQMIYDENGPICNRLIYLINHWQAGWGVIPTSKNSPTPHGRYCETEYGLMPKKPKSLAKPSTVFEYIIVGYFTNALIDKTISYKEEILKSTSDNGSVVYDKLVADVKQCLGDTDWIFSTDVKEDKEKNAKCYYSFFHIKGRAKDQPQSILSIKHIVPEKPTDFNEYKVLLLFN